MSRSEREGQKRSSTIPYDSFLRIYGTRIIVLLCFFVVEILSFKILFQKVYQYIACEQADLCEFGGILLTCLASIG